MSELDAMRAAMLSYAQPLRQPERPSVKLQDGLILVIKCAAGDAATTERLTEELGTSAKILQEAASFYLQKHLIGGKVNSFQQLGLSDHASLEDVVLHKRWLLKWLHPDRNPNKWQSAMFNSVTNAAAAASAMVTSDQAGAKNALPITTSAMSKSGRRAHSGPSHRMPSRNHKRKRVRIINWRELFARLGRRAVLITLLLPLVYFGANKLFGWQTNWAISSYDFWLK